MRKTVTILICAILTASFVAAAGTSTAGQKPSETNPAASSKAGANPTTGGLAVRPCEERETPRDRILCRLQQGKDPAPAVEESCRDIKDPAGCSKLYTEALSCYKETGADKDRCFKRAIGFTHSSVRSEASKNAAGVRQYVVLLLYDLQEKVEDAHEEGKITDEEAANLIAKIVSTKQVAFNAASPAEIQAEIAGLKIMWQEVMR